MLRSTHPQDLILIRITNPITRCSSPIGLFLNIRKCMILFLHVPSQMYINAPRLNRRGSTTAITTISNGSWFAAPYLTKHGEIDPGLRQRHQLILNQKRYDRILRDAWLMVNATVWSTIARKLEGEVNGGGWESI
jgi:E3 ubiquitin-protein ligase UBR1